MKKNKANATYIENESRYTLGEQTKAQTLFDNSIWLTTEEAAALLRKSVHAIRQLLYKGKLPGRKFNGRLYFSKSELCSLVDTSFF